MNVASLIGKVREAPLLWGIVALAFLLRVAGVGYGLPLTVINDETPFTFAALQMIQSHTFIPALHPELFSAILPYPPYLSYILLVPFVAILGIKLLFFHGSLALFQAHVLSDLSAFFITARLVNVIFGTLSVFLVYRIAETLFRSASSDARRDGSRVAAVAAGFLLATSVLHEALSMVGRNWIPVSFAFLLVLFILTREWESRRRYMLAFVIAGIGMGISSISVFSLLMAGLYYLLFDLKSLSQMRKDIPAFAFNACVFAILTAVPFLLWHSGNAFLGALTLSEHKTFFGLITSPWSSLSLMIFSEPVLVATFLGGLVFLCARQRRIGIFMGVWFLAYVSIFYIFFRFDPRFLAPLIPLFAIAGGYCVSKLWNPRVAFVWCLLFLIPFMSAVRLSYLVQQGDTREHVREWALAHLKPDDKVLVFSSAMHIPTQAAAVAELRSIDAGAVRKADEADQVLDRHDVPYALNNLTSFTDPEVVSHLPVYARRHGYRYLILEPRSLPMASANMIGALASLTKGASVLERLDGLSDDTSMSNSSFTESFAVLFSHGMMGPDMVIYRLAP